MGTSLKSLGLVLGSTVDKPIKNKFRTLKKLQPVMPIPNEIRTHEKKSGSQCQQPVGGGSYTWISFGSPHKPIYAFHTLHDHEKGFIFSSGSGFKNKTLSKLSYNDNIIRKRKVKGKRPSEILLPKIID